MSVETRVAFGPSELREETMNNENKAIETDRRSFLKLASVGAAASGVAAVAGTAGAQAAQDAGQAADGRYHETAHVRRYYDLARF